MASIAVPRASPPDFLRHAFKKYQKLSFEELGKDPHLIDSQQSSSSKELDRLQFEGFLSGEKIGTAVGRFQGLSPSSYPCSDRPSYTFHNLPGLTVVPSLLPEECQRELLSKILHRDLIDCRHRTNVHLHHHIQYPTAMPNSGTYIEDPGNASFFSHHVQEGLVFPPKSPETHRPLTISQFLNKKLRWITLGGQYDWTRKAYPEDRAPDFPSDISALVRGLFPEMVPEAAIVNLYSPGDTLSLHRDISEYCDRGLVSISLGCDAIFVIGLDDSREEDQKADLHSAKQEDEGERYLVIRLHSGDAVYMSGPARYAWHGVPRILPGTCPGWLEDWPAEREEDGHKSTEFDHWRGWMVNKRVNLNVRQMYET